MNKLDATAILCSRKTLKCCNTPSSDVCEGRFTYDFDRDCYIKSGKGCFQKNFNVAWLDTRYIDYYDLYWYDAELLKMIEGDMLCMISD